MLALWERLRVCKLQTNHAGGLLETKTVTRTPVPEISWTVLTYHIINITVSAAAMVDCAGHGRAGQAITAASQLIVTTSQYRDE